MLGCALSLVGYFRVNPVTLEVRPSRVLGRGGRSVPVALGRYHVAVWCGPRWRVPAGTGGNNPSQHFRFLWCAGILSIRYRNLMEPAPIRGEDCIATLCLLVLPPAVVPVTVGDAGVRRQN